MQLWCGCVYLCQNITPCCDVGRQWLPRFNPPVRSASISAPTRTSPFTLLNRIPAKLKWQKQPYFFMIRLGSVSSDGKVREASRSDIILSPEGKNCESRRLFSRRCCAKVLNKGHHLLIHCRSTSSGGNLRDLRLFSAGGVFCARFYTARSHFHTYAWVYFSLSATWGWKVWLEKSRSNSRRIWWCHMYPRQIDAIMSYVYLNPHRGDWNNYLRLIFFYLLIFPSDSK